MLKDRDEVENESLRMKEGRSNQPIQGEVERAKKKIQEGKKLGGRQFQRPRESRREAGENT